MNDIVRTNIKERLVKAIESEKLLAQDVAAIFQMHPSYISWFKNVKYWDKIGEKFWERVLTWINSGQSLREWSEKHGKVLNENSPTDTKRDKTGTEKKEIVSEPDKIMPEKVESVLIEHKKPVVLEEDTAVSQAQIGWILNYNKEGKSAEQISRKLKIYLPIVQQIITGTIVPLHKSHSVLEKEFVDPVAEALWQQCVDDVEKENQKKNSIEPRDEKLVVLLLGEKESLKHKLDAVDYLIKLYTS